MFRADMKDLIREKNYNSDSKSLFYEKQTLC